MLFFSYLVLFFVGISCPVLSSSQLLGEVRNSRCALTELKSKDKHLKKEAVTSRLSLGLFAFKREMCMCALMGNWPAL